MDTTTGAFYKSFYESTYTVVSTECANIFGLKESILIRVIADWIRDNKKGQKKQYFKAGHWWTRMSYTYIAKHWKFLGSDKNIQKLINTLERIGVLISCQFNENKIDKTKWYRIDIDKAEQLIEQGLNERALDDDGSLDCDSDDRESSSDGDYYSSDDRESSSDQCESSSDINKDHSTKNQENKDHTNGARVREVKETPLSDIPNDQPKTQSEEPETRENIARVVCSTTSAIQKTESRFRGKLIALEGETTSFERKVIQSEGAQHVLTAMRERGLELSLGLWKRYLNHIVEYLKSKTSNKEATLVDAQNWLVNRLNVPNGETILEGSIEGFCSKLSPNQKANSDDMSLPYDATEWVSLAKRAKVIDSHKHCWRDDNGTITHAHSSSGYYEPIAKLMARYSIDYLRRNCD